MKCKTSGCDNTISERSRMDHCPNCRASFGYWQKKRPAQVLIRRAKLQLYSQRIRIIVDDRGLDDGR